MMGKAEGVKNGVTREDRRTQPIFYVYVYWIGDTPFYVGKGWRHRSSQHFLPSEWGKGDTLMRRKMAKLIREGRRGDIRVEFFIKEVDEETAFFWEGFLIRALGRRCDRDGTLCNLTWGGDKSNTGYTHSQERRDKISRANRARWRTVAGRKQILEGMNTGRRPNPEKSLETIENQKATRAKTETEQIRLLRSGSISWHTKRLRWVVIVRSNFIGKFRKFTGAEWHQVEACKAIRDGRLDVWLAERRAAREAPRELKRQEWKAFERALDKFRSAERKAFEVVRLLREDFDKAAKAKKWDQKRRDCPWLVESPHCAFVFLVDGQVQYVGFGRPDRIWRVLYKNEKLDNPLKMWINSLGEKPEVCAVFMETREQAKAWRAAMINEFDPPINKLHRKNQNCPKGRKLSAQGVENIRQGNKRQRERRAAELCGA